jgi:hypothetical protein
MAWNQCLTGQNMDDKTPPDYTALAQRYLELWQDQVAKLAKDPPKDLGDLSAMTAAWSKIAASMTSPAGAPPYDAASGAPGPAAAAPSHGDGGMDRPSGHGRADAGLAARLDTRLDALEQRLGILESRLAGLAGDKPVGSGPRNRGLGRGKKP